MTIATYESRKTTIGLGTFISVQTRASSASAAQRGVDTALAAIDLVDRLMHPQRVGSDLRAIRDAPPDSTVAIHRWTLRVLRLCRRIHAASEGRFDPSLPHAGRLSDVELQHDAPTDLEPRVIVRAAVQLDLGGIAKGFAVDRAIDALQVSGCHSGLVNCGGDVAVFGPEEQRIACIDQRGRGVWVALHNAALASSDIDNPHRPPEHRGYYDGRNRSALTSGRAVIRAPSAALADALTKCLLAGMGRDAAAWLAQFGAEQIVC